MATKPDKPLKRDMTWETLVSGDAALSVALNASLQR
jgi:hypothetical protein